VEGATQHKRVDEKTTPLPAAADLPESIHSRSATLSSETLRVIAKMDLVEAEGGIVTPVDYKHGRPREGPDGLELWPADRAQLAVRALFCGRTVRLPRRNRSTTARRGQRVRVAFRNERPDCGDPQTDRRCVGAGRKGEIPPPLIDSPKCPGCSLAGICLPDETLAAARRKRRASRCNSNLFGTPRRQGGEARGEGAGDAAQ